jgi:broad specificity phosphatase PhoE
MPSIVLVRHAQASFGAADYDVLSDLGHEQVEAVARALDRRGMRVERIVSGSLRRQRDTAAPFAALAGLEVEVDPRWNEYESDAVLVHHAETDVRLDHAEGARTVSSREFQPLLEAALLDWIARGDDSPADETYPAFAARVRDALTAAADGLGSGATAVVCTSGGPIAAICGRLLGAGPESLVTFNRVAINTGMTKIAVGRGGMTLVSFNEHEHLEGEAARLLTYR